MHNEGARGVTDDRDPLPRPAAASEPTDGELERAIVTALTRGLDGVAKTLTAQLEARQRARLPANVEQLDRARARRGGR